MTAIRIIVQMVLLCLTNTKRRCFEGCKSLTSVTLPSGVKNVSIYTFRDCESLRSINLPSDLKYIGMYAFEGCI